MSDRFVPFRKQRTRRFDPYLAESGGQAVQAPTRRGFGTTLIERALTHELDAEVRREFAVSGMHCTIEIQLTEEVARPRPARYRQGNV